MTYEEIYSQFYLKQTDKEFFKKYTKEEAYEMMLGWMKSVIAMPYIRKCFSSITFDDELAQVSFTLKESIDEESDEYFVIDMFAQGLVICWMQQKIDKAVSLATVIGGKEEKRILDNYKSNITRLKELKLELKKYIRDYGYQNNEYIGEV